MGARPLTALNLVAWPRALGFELLGRVVEGSSAVCAEAGVAVVGGHSVDDPEPKFGLAVTGTVHPDHVVRTSGAAPGSDLVLTKPLGTGIVASAIKEQKASARAMEEVTAVMTRLNAGASAAMVAIGVEAATDVTGFGLAGHLLEMLGGSSSARLDFDALPILEDAVALARRGIFPGGSKRNRDTMAEHVRAEELDDAERALLFDAQTSGGLLIAVDPDKTSRLLQAVSDESVPDARRIGSIIEGDGGI